MAPWRPRCCGKPEFDSALSLVPSRRVPHLYSVSAAVLRRPGGPLVIEDLEMEGPRDDEVLVRLVASSRGAGGPGELLGGRKVLDVVQGDAVLQRFRLYRQGRFPFDRLVTFHDFADINRAIADERSGKTIKAVRRIGGRQSPPPA